MATQPVLILGAGINGASVARELVLNGVACWVVDQQDIACGATSKSSRLIHGGLRYLEYGEFRLVREALRERDRLLRTAPQFVRPLTFAVPVRHRGGGWSAALKRLVGFSAANHSPRGLWLTRTGLRLYDFFSRRSPLPRHTVVRRKPGVAPNVGGDYQWICTYADAQMPFPERYTVALLRDAAEIAERQGLDFRVLPYHLASRQGSGILINAQRRAGHPPIGQDTRGVQPSLPGSTHALIEPPLVVNATGAWGDTTLEALAVPSRTLFAGTKGSHLVIDSPPLRGALGEFAVYAETPDGRFVFVLPFGEHVLLGTTDEPFVDDPHRAIATGEEVEYLNELVRLVFPDVAVRAADIICRYSGVRPLPFSDATTPGAVSRDHHIVTSGTSPPVLTLVGGKLTTSRQLGEQVADLVLARLARSRRGSTRDRVLPGGTGLSMVAADREARLRDLAQHTDASLHTVRRLESLCGNAFDTTLRTLSSDDRKLVSGTELPRGFVRWVIRHEWVRGLSDLVERRLMLVLAPGISAATLEELAEMLAAEAVLDAADVSPEIAACRRRLNELYGYRW